MGTVSIAKKISQRTTPRQEKFAKGLGRVVNTFVNTKKVSRKKR